MAPSSWLAIGICLGVLAAMVAVGRWAARLTAEDYLVRGLNAQDQPALAVAEFERAIALAPALPEAFFNRALALARLERLDDAIRDLNTVIALRRDFPDAYNRRAALLALQGKHALAAADYTEAIRQTSYDDQAYLGRANAHHALGWIEQALQDYGRALELNPLDPAIYLNRARALLLAGETAQALADYEAAFARGLDDPAAYRERAQVLAGLGRWAETEAAYARLIESAPPDQSAAERASDHVGRAQARYRLGQRDLALMDYEQSLALTPLAEAYLGRGQIHSEMERYAQAIGDFDLGLALAPGNSSLYNDRGYALACLERHQEALADYGRAAIHGLGVAKVWINTALAHEALGDYEAALYQIEKAVRAEPGNPWGYVHRARLGAKANRPARAWRTDFAQALTLESKNASIFNDAAWFLALDGVPVKALDLAERALTLQDEPAFRDTRGLCLALMGRLEQAIPDFSAYIESLRQQDDPLSRAKAAQREQWMAALRAGENPFTPEVLAVLYRGTSGGASPEQEPPAV